MQNEQEEAEVVLIASKLTCRLCLQKHTDINSMLSSFSDEKSIADIYEICFNFKVNTSLITTSICSWCEDNLVRVFNFKNQVESVERILLSYTKTVSNINSIDEDHLYEVEVIGADDESLFESLVDEGWSDQDKLEPTADVVYECDKLENNPEVLSCCGKIFKSKGSLTNHIRIAHTKDARYACRYCDSKFLHWNVRHSHETLVHERKRQFVCIFCDRKFYRKDKMQIHIKRHHLKEFKFECNLCDKKFVINRELKQHLQVHANCERGEASSKKHIQKTLTKHQKGDLKNYDCLKCKNTFADLRAFETHVKKVHKETKKFFKCGYCIKSFSRKDRMLEHEILHTEDQIFQCQVCHKIFSKKSIYNIHIKQHEKSAKGIKYSCDHCEKSYMYRATLLRHLQNHFVGNSQTCQ